MLQNLVAVALTIERQDLIRDLVRSYRKTWEQSYAVNTEDGNVIVDLDRALPQPPLVVVNMGDDDGTEGWLRNQAEQGLPLSVVRHPPRLSYAQAMNLGVRVALEAYPTAEWLLLLNDDLVLQPGFWAALQEMTGWGYEIVGAKLLYPEGHAHAGQIQHTGKLYTLDYFPFHVLRYQPSDVPQSMTPRPFPSVTFACVAIKRVVWEALGGLDEGYINGFEDDHFCLAARERGAQIGVHPGMLAIHRENATTGKDDANKQAQYERFHSIWIETGRIAWPLGVFNGWRTP